MWIESKSRLNSVVASGFLIALMMVSSGAYAYTHKYINESRSSTESNVYVSQAFSGEYGTFNFKRSADNGADTSQVWQGYGFENGIGLEIMKFIQFHVGHTFVNLRSKNDASERMNGSRLLGGAKLVFSAPVGNLEVGTGISALRWDYQYKLEHASFYGSGMYYSLGINYFLSPRVSFFGTARQTKENLVRSSGTTSVDNVKTNTHSIGFGFSLWL